MSIKKNSYPNFFLVSAEHNFYAEWFPDPLQHSFDLMDLFNGFPEHATHPKIVQVKGAIHKCTLHNISLLGLSYFVMQHPVDGLPMHLPCNSREVTVETMTKKVDGESIRDVAIWTDKKKAEPGGRFNSQSVVVFVYAVEAMTDANRAGAVKPEGMVTVNFKEDEKVIKNVTLKQDLAVARNIDRECLMLILMLFNYPPISLDIVGLLRSVFQLLEDINWIDPQTIKRMFMDKTRLGLLFEGTDLSKVPDFELCSWMASVVQLVSPFRLSVPEGAHRMSSACIFGKGYDIIHPFPQSMETRRKTPTPRKQLCDTVQTDYWYRTFDQPIDQEDITNVRSLSLDIQGNRELVVVSQWRTFYIEVARRFDNSSYFDDLPAHPNKAKEVFDLAFALEKALHRQLDTPLVKFCERVTPLLEVFWEVCTTYKPMKSTMKSLVSKDEQPPFEEIRRGLKEMEMYQFFTAFVSI